MRKKLPRLIILGALLIAAGLAADNARQAAGTLGEEVGGPPDGARQNAMDSKQQIGVPGNQMKAFLVAYQSFVRDPEIPRQKRNIENYNIGLSETGEYYSVFFSPKRGPGEPVRPGGSTELGKAVTYKIGKGDYRIVEKFFYR